MTPTSTQLFLLALAWMGYFIAHSLLASVGLKRLVAGKYPRLMPAYRLVFNLLALLLLILPLWLLYQYQGTPLWQWQGFEKWISNALRFSAVFAFIWTLKYYDGSEILGIRQFQASEQSVEDQENFHISPFHRFVRHPWYFFSLVFIWTGDMQPAWLLSAIMLSLYFIIGSWLEERKLLSYHGQVYRRYAKSVPGLIPIPWRYLSRADAQKLLEESASL